jgi:hypothetical protein
MPKMLGLMMAHLQNDFFFLYCEFDPQQIIGPDVNA